ncbi:MAG: hypothetical protein BWK76_14555 [Desulfobulbaceae bacterium A2]|nr:MAG: hypothetical protein BWK76_14555 [Desulfobulbaceae bacterium A2]
MSPLRPRRLALFLPADTPFYRQLFTAMRQGFVKQRVEVFGACRLLEQAELLESLAAWRVNVVLEMNRTRNALPELPAAMRHISWIVDTNGRHGASFAGSDILYFFGAPWLNHHPHNDHQFMDWLPPGASPELYPYAERPYKSVLSFVGHIPRPWSSAERERVVASGLTFGALYPRLLEHWTGMTRKNFANDQYLQSAQSLIRELLGEDLGLEDPVLRYDIGCRSVRMMNRSELVSLALGASRSLRLYGPDNWLHWPEFAPYYIGFLTTPAQMTAVYQGSRCNLHEGVGPHFRSFDCMAAGGVLLYRRSPDDHEYGGLATLFEPGVQYLDCDSGDIREQVAACAADTRRCRAIGRAAAGEIRARHTWTHRASKILADLREID